MSALCGSKRSVLVINSVRKLPPIPENEADSEIETEVEIHPSSGKLHAAESRDSGIGENDIPNYFHRVNGSGFLRSSSNDSSPEKKKEKENEDEEMTSARPSRPHSCRLGHRGHPSSAKRTRKTEVSESQIRRMVHSGRRQSSNNVKSFDLDGSNDKVLDFSDNDTLSNNSSSSPIRDARPKSAKRRHRRNARARETKNSARKIRDLDTSTESDISDTDMLSIPDETGSFHRGKNVDQRRGWVGIEDFTDIMVTSSRTPRTPGDFYRIVSGSFADADLNLAKKASERSISSVILTPMDGSCTLTNSECFDAPNDFLYHDEGVSFISITPSSLTFLIFVLVFETCDLGF